MDDIEALEIARDTLYARARKGEEKNRNGGAYFGDSQGYLDSLRGAAAEIERLIRERHEAYR